MKKIVKPGTDVYRATCTECGAVFTYEREDVCRSHVGDYVTCPNCGHNNRHFGASSTAWPKGAGA